MNKLVKSVNSAIKRPLGGEGKTTPVREILKWTVPFLGGLIVQGFFISWNQGQSEGRITTKLESVELRLTKIENGMVSKEVLDALLREAGVTHLAIRNEIESERRERVAQVDALRAERYRSR